MERRYRITASVFGKVLKRKKECNTKFLTSLFGSKPVHSSSLTYGQVHEVDGKEDILVNPSYSFLGASPDAKVCCGGQTGILEVKCPYSARNKTVRDVVLTVPNFYLNAEGDSLELDKGHDYFYQVQGHHSVTLFVTASTHTKSAFFLM
ncbi:uncharacterized protein LOC144903810 [Branchiostoma floridae x Branchiostoma belcheri]